MLRLLRPGTGSNCGAMIALALLTFSVAPVTAGNQACCDSGPGGCDEGGFKENSAQAGGGAKAGGDMSGHFGSGGQITPEMRIKRQFMRIKRGEMTGQLSPEQAKTLRQGVSEAESQMQDLQAKGGGSLKPEDLKAIETRLHENANQIQTMLGAGTHKVESEKVLGPKWTPGPDGAQDPKSLLKEMKAEEKRELRQERQRNMQAIEQQQLDYEKGMLNNLGNQRPDIQKDKRQLEKVRQTSGADGTVRDSGQD